MMKLMMVSILLGVSTAHAEEAYVTCRQSDWTESREYNWALSKKELNCVRIETNFWSFQSLTDKAAEVCQNWRETEAVSQLRAQVFAEQGACTQEFRQFLSGEVSTKRAVVRDLEYPAIGREYLLFQDAATPYWDAHANKERARWAHLDGQWYCALPGQDFYARYELRGSDSRLFVRSLNGGEHVYEYKTFVGDTVYWINADSGADWSRAESTLYMHGRNAITFKDSAGRSQAQFRMTALMDPHRSVLSSCY